MTITITLTDREQAVLDHALGVAAEQFDRHAVTSAEARYPAMAEQFRRRARETRNVRERIAVETAE